MTIDIKNKLDDLVEKYHVPSFIENDPVQFPRRYSHLHDIEIAAFLTATISWGNRKAVLKSAEKMLALLGDSPYEYVMSNGYANLRNQNIHRTFFESDLYYLCKGFQYMYDRYFSLEEIFMKHESIWESIHLFRSLMCEANETSCKHISNPTAGSACKRLNMALRWLVRQDSIVDMGVWKNISPAALLIPLDTHVARISREFGILRRTINDRKAVDELSAFLKELNPEDPVIYDFALFGLGEATK